MSQSNKRALGQDPLRQSPTPTPARLSSSLAQPTAMDVDSPAPASPNAIPETLGNFKLVTQVKLDYSPTQIVKWQSQETGLKVVWIDVEGALIVCERARGPCKGSRSSAPGGTRRSSSPPRLQVRSSRATLRSSPRSSMTRDGPIRWSMRSSWAAKSEWRVSSCGWRGGAC